MKNYKELEVWQKAKRLAVECYRGTGTFPRAEHFGLASQIRRAASSVPANIAEGWGRGSTREYVQFLLVARGSLMELETHLIIAQELGCVTEEKSRAFQDQIQSIGQMLNRLVQSLKARWDVKRDRPRTPKPESRTPSD